MNMFKYIKYKKSFFFGFFTKSIEVLFELFLPIFMAILMNEGLKEGGDINKAYLMVILILLATFLGYLTTLYSQRISALVGQDYAKNLRQELFHHIQDLSIEDTNNFSESTLLNRLSIDVSNLQNSLSMTIRIASRAPAVMIGSIIALFILSPKIALVLVIGLPILILILIFVMITSMKIFEKFQVQNDELLDVVKDNVEGSRMIRAFAQTKHEEQRYLKRNERLSKVMIKLGKVTSISSPFTMLSLNILLVIMLYLGANEVHLGRFDDAQLLQVINYTTQLTISIIAVMNLALLYTKAYASSKRVNEILNIKNSVVNKKEAINLNSKEGLKIEFKNVSFSYGGGMVLKNVSFKIKSGQTIGIVGLTASGKTTIVDLIMRFFNVTEGEILINDININEYNIKSLRENISYASQKASLFAGTIKDNLNMNNQYNEEELINSLNDASANFILKRKDNLNEVVLREGSNFSGGQKQRIALSRALVKDSSLLILDDVFSALDYITDFNIRKNLKQKHKNQTKIFISQRLSSIKDADKILVVDEGEIINIGTHDELLLDSKLYKDLYNTQVSGDKND